MLRRFMLPTLGAALVAVAACDRSPTGTGLTNPALGRGINPRNAAALGRSGPLLAILPGTSTAMVTNGTVEMYVNPEGHLNTYEGCNDGSDPTSNSGCQKGLLYVPTNTEATAPGCLCEGWGASADGVSGDASIASGGINNVRVISFTENGTRAVSVTGIDNGGAPWLEVTQDYHPSPVTPNLYEVTVTLKNVSGAAMSDVRYTRAMDWDIGPTTFREYVTIQGWGAANLLHSDNNGFDNPNPLRWYSNYGMTNQNFVDAGPSDHGAVFDFGFGGLAAGAERKFNIYYGAAGSEPDAQTAITRVHAEVWSFGQPSHTSDVCSGSGGGGGDDGSPPPDDGSGPPPDDGSGPPPATSVAAAPRGSANNPTTCPPSADHGTPNTFIFAFGQVGGAVLNTPPSAPTFGPPGYRYTGTEGSPLCLTITASDPDGDALKYIVNWGDGTTTTETTNKPCHVYADGPNSYTGTVVVTADDGHGGTAAGTTNVSISNVAPTISTVKFSTTIMNRPRVGQSFPISWVWSDKGVIDAPWSWSIAWGDGTTSTGTKATISQVDDSHRYATAGSKTLVFTITDKDGASVSKSIPVVVTP